MKCDPRACRKLTIGKCLSKNFDKSMYEYYNKNYYNEGGVIMPTDEQKLWGVWGQANGIYSSWADS